jgi:dTDP-4-dehydrorhamnose reductase
MSQILVLGGRGMLGSDIVSVLSGLGHDVKSLGSQEIDISTPFSVESVLSPYSKADLVINCAAYTKVDLAESEFDKAMAVNGYGVGHLSRFCKSHHLPLIHFSTDYVFDGTKPVPYSEKDNTNPINKYGESKFKGEFEFLDSGVKGYIFRIEWLYGLKGNHFIKTITRLAKSNPSLSIVSDQWGSPTWTYDVAEMIACVIQNKPPKGIYHFSSQGYTNWADFARTFLSISGIECDIIDIPSTKYLTPAKRPMQSRLDISKFLSLGIYTPRPWQDSVSQFLKEATYL